MKFLFLGWVLLVKKHNLPFQFKNKDGVSWQMLYKVYTHRPIVDMGAFSPRQYTLEKKTYNFANSLKCNLLITLLPLIMSILSVLDEIRQWM